MTAPDLYTLRLLDWACAVLHAIDRWQDRRMAGRYGAMK